MPKPKNPKRQPDYKTGRPTDYSEELGKRICDLVIVSPYSLEQLCREHEDLPNASSIYLWISRHEEFSKIFLEAKRKQVMVYADNTIQIADDEASDVALCAFDAQALRRQNA